MTYRVFKLEMMKLYCSPITWGVVTLFLLKTGLDFSALIQSLFDAQRYRGSVDLASFTLLTGLFESVSQSLFIIVPLLTMGLVSQEVSSGTIRLIYSSPVKLRSFVLGKYFAMVMVSAILVLLTGVLGASLATFIPGFEWSILISGIVGLLLLAAAYSAIGLFISALASIQIIAALATLAVFVLLDFLGDLTIGAPVLGDVFYAVSISRHAEPALSGLFASKDVLYFIAITVCFVVFTWLHLIARRQIPEVRLKLLGAMSITALATMLFSYLVSVPTLNKSYDVTATKLHSLNPLTQRHLLALNGPVRATTYFDVLNTFLFSPENQRNYERSFDQYLRAKPDIRFSFKAFYSASPDTSNLPHRTDLTPQEKVSVLAEYYNINDSISDRRELVDNDPFLAEYLTSRSLNVMSHEERKVAVQLGFSDSVNMGRTTEEEYAVALKLLSQDPVTVGYFTGARSAGLSEIKSTDWGVLLHDPTMRHSLSNNGFRITTIGVEVNDEIDHVDLLIVADPKTPLSDEEYSLLENYIESGRDLLVAIEPDFAETNVRLLSLFGLKQDGPSFEAGDLDVPPEYVTAVISSAAKEAFTPRSSESVTLNSVARLSVTGDAPFDAEPVVTDARDHPVIWALTRQKAGREQRILISGDAGLFANTILEDIRRSAARVPERVLLIEDLFAWLTKDEFPIRLRRTHSQDTVLTLTPFSIAIYGAVYAIVIPLTAMFGGVIVFVSRRRR